MRLVLFFALLSLHGALAQDPARGWLGYATGLYTADRNARITFIEAYWKCGASPVKSTAFFSPWFGIDTSDNLNLLQPVNPWTGSQWEIYNEYYQWQPTYNQNSQSHVVNPGDVLYGSITFNQADESYMLYHKDMTSGWSVNMSIPVQKSGTQFKNYTIIYFVYEKVAQCYQYPPDGNVTFYNIRVDYEGKTVTPQIQWTTAYVEDVCNNRAHIVDQQTIQITWNTGLKNGREQETTADLKDYKQTAGVTPGDTAPPKPRTHCEGSSRREGMAYREEAPVQREAGMAYREEAPVHVQREAGMAYREEAPVHVAREAGMAYREEAPVHVAREAGMAYREVHAYNPQLDGGMAYREVADNHVRTIAGKVGYTDH